MGLPRLALFLALVVAMLLAALRVSRARGTLSVADVRVSARTATMSLKGAPPSWNWQQIDERDARAWQAAFGGRLAPGVYASDVFDQHVSRWCGCCYLVAAVQSVQDRLHVALGLRDPDARMFPCYEFNMQLALDTYNAHERASNPDWNACLGGVPLRVFEAIRQGACALQLNRRGSVWLGHPSNCDLDEEGSVVDLAESAVQQNRPDWIMRRIQRYGPVVLGINARCLLTGLSPDGIIDGTESAKPDHAVVVTGWRHCRGRPHWILRNSWGTERVPAQRPGDATCVGTDYNECTTDHRRWVGDAGNPGYAYVPFEYRGIAGLPSPWFDAVPAALRAALPPDEDDGIDFV